MTKHKWGTKFSKNNINKGTKYIGIKKNIPKIEFFFQSSPIKIPVTTTNILMGYIKKIIVSII